MMNRLCVLIILNNSIQIKKIIFGNLKSLAFDNWEQNSLAPWNITGQVGRTFSIQYPAQPFLVYFPLLTWVSPDLRCFARSELLALLIFLILFMAQPAMMEALLVFKALFYTLVIVCFIVCGISLGLLGIILFTAIKWGCPSRTWQIIKFAASAESAGFVPWIPSIHFYRAQWLLSEHLYRLWLVVFRTQFI